MSAPTAFTVGDAERVATELHAGQVDKAGRPYTGHLARTAAGAASVAPADLRDDAAITGWLHDSREDTGTTAAELRELGVPPDVVEAVILLTEVERSRHARVPHPHLPQPARAFGQDRRHE